MPPRRTPRVSPSSSSGRDQHSLVEQPELLDGLTTPTGHSSQADTHSKPSAVATPLSVSAVTALIADLVGALPRLRVVGQISNFKAHSSGHLYFSIRDERSILPAVMWRSAAARLAFDPQDGLEVVATGRLEVYAPRGGYQLMVDRLEPVGVGRLQQAFEALHARLAAAGLFDAHRKRRLPRFPRTVALLTSPTGAAVADMLEVFARRYPKLRILISPVRVQGPSAPEDIATGLAELNAQAHSLGGLDVIIVGRGGGSRDDLAAFNTEIVVRAIANSAVPVVSAVGHEIDTTLADLAADVRALTPTEAAERVTPVLAEVYDDLSGLAQRLSAALGRRAVVARQRLEALTRRRALADPDSWLRPRAQALDELDEQLDVAMRRTVDHRRQHLAHQAGRLGGVSPLAVLARGYAVVQRADTAAVVRRPGDVAPGDRLTLRLAGGTLAAQALAGQTPQPPIPLAPQEPTVP